MTKFEVGKTYTKRSVGDSGQTYSVRIIKRTASTVTADLSGCGEQVVKNFRVQAYNGIEFFKPLGSYALAPIISADSVEDETLTIGEMVNKLKHTAAALPSEFEPGPCGEPIGPAGVRRAFDRLAKMAGTFAENLGEAGEK